MENGFTRSKYWHLEHWNFGYLVLKSLLLINFRNVPGTYVLNTMPIKFRWIELNCKQTLWCDQCSKAQQGNLSRPRLRAHWKQRFGDSNFSGEVMFLTGQFFAVGSQGSDVIEDLTHFQFQVIIPLCRYAKRYKVTEKLLQNLVVVWKN